MTHCTQLGGDRGAKPRCRVARMSCPPVPTLAYTPEFEANHSTLLPITKGRAGTSEKSSPPPHLVEALQLHTVCGVPLTMMPPAKCWAVQGAATAIAPDATPHRMPACRTLGNDIAVS